MRHDQYKKIYIWTQKHYIGKLINKIPDRIYVRAVYLMQCHKWLNLKYPRTFTEKIQWLKLHEDYSVYWRMVDKYEAKKIVEKKLGKQYIIPTYTVVTEMNEIDIDSLPMRFVLKCTHDSGSVYVCKNKEKFNYAKIKEKIEGLMQIDYFYYLREKQYKRVSPKIIIEKFIENESNEPMEYKFFCFSGIPKIVMVILNDNGIRKSNFYDMKFKKLDLRIENPNFGQSIKCPKEFEKMKKVAQILSEGFRFIRVDLYYADNQIFFGEYTFQHWGGFSHINPVEWEKRMGEWIEI